MVKGKGEMETYFVTSNDNEEHATRVRRLKEHLLDTNSPTRSAYVSPFKETGDVLQESVASSSTDQKVSVTDRKVVYQSNVVVDVNGELLIDQVALEKKSTRSLLQLISRK